MRSTQTPRNDFVTEQFINLATEISNLFPDLDLRFNLQQGTKRLRFTLPTVTKDVFELELNPENITPTVYEAAFTIKEITQRFDA